MRHRPSHPGTDWTPSEPIPDLPGKQGWGGPRQEQGISQEGALGEERVWGWVGCTECPVGLGAAQQDPGLDPL